MGRLDGPPSLMIVSDLDNTMFQVDHRDQGKSSSLRFGALWESDYCQDSLLVFSTGRSPTRYKELRNEKPMLTPHITVMSMGTEIAYGEAMVPEDGWEEYLNNRWDRNIVLQETAKFPELKLKPKTEQRPHKLCFSVDKKSVQKVIKSLSEKFQKRGVDVKIIYIVAEALDIIPQMAGMSWALAYLLRSRLDTGLFSIPGVHGVIVNNADEELRQ